MSLNHASRTAPPWYGNVAVYVLDIASSAFFLMKLPLATVVAAWAMASIISAFVNGIPWPTIELNVPTVDVCTVPLVWVFVPSCPPVILPGSFDQRIRHADFPSLIDIQHRALDDLIAASTANADLVVNLRHAELLVRDLVVMVQESNLTAKATLANALQQFVVGSRVSARKLQILSAKIRGTSDRSASLLPSHRRYAYRFCRVLAFNSYSLNLIEGATTMRSSDVNSMALYRAFQSSMASFSDTITSIIVEASSAASSLDMLSEHLSTIHALCIQESFSTVLAMDDLFWQLWTLLGGNRHQVRDLENRASVLRNIQEYRVAATAYVAATIQILSVVDADLEALREQVSSASQESEVPLVVQMASIQRSMEHIRDTSFGKESGGAQHGLPGR